MHKVSNERLAEMLAGLEGVTPGPWNEGDKWVFVSPASGKPRDALESVLAANKPQANAAHIARCDPDTIRALILELQALRSPPTEDADRVGPVSDAMVERSLLSPETVGLAAQAIYENGPSIGGDTEDGWLAQSEGYKQKARAIAHVVICAALSPQEGK